MLRNSGAGDADAVLVEVARAGNRAAFGILAQRHRPLALRLCRQVVRDPSLGEDAVQEAVLQSWLGLAKLRSPDRFGAWLAGIALHVCQGWLRYRADQAWSLDALLGGRLVTEPIDTAPPPAETAELHELGARIRRTIGELPTGQRAAVALFYLADLSHAEIAGVLGIQPGAVKTRLHKARGRLRLALLDLWLDEHMTHQTDFYDVDVEDVRAVTTNERPGDRRVVMLKEREGERLLPIWVGGFEGDAIAIALLRAEVRRPLTHAFAYQLLQTVGGRLAEVRIDRLIDETFYAQVILETPNGSQKLDARPSDAIALALEASAPIRASSAVMEQAGATREQLAKTRPVLGDSRGARAKADEIRERLTQHRTSWSVSSLSRAKQNVRSRILAGFLQAINVRSPASSAR